MAGWSGPLLKNMCNPPPYTLPPSYQRLYQRELARKSGLPHRLKKEWLYSIILNFLIFYTLKASLSISLKLTMRRRGGLSPISIAMPTVRIWQIQFCLGERETGSQDPNGTFWFVFLLGQITFSSLGTTGPAGGRGY